MTTLDIDKKAVGATIVLHDSNLPGVSSVTSLAKRYSVNVYEGRSPFLSTGYQELLPVTNQEVIEARQETIRVFEGDMDKFYSPLNIMHLINKWSSLSENDFDSAKGAKILRRYISEAEVLKDELRGAGGVLERIAEDIEKDCSFDEIETLAGVCERGKFERLMIVSEGEHYKVIGIEGRELPEIKRYLGEYDLKEQMGWRGEGFALYAFLVGMKTLNDFFSPLGALYFEAAYMQKRKADGKSVCLPEINNQDIFEMIEGEPVLPTQEPVAWRTFGFDTTNSNSILNGLHSGGKTHLLRDIPLYILRGLRGFSLPAKSSKIPIVRRIFHSESVEKIGSVGSLESEMYRRAQEVLLAKKGDLFLIDEFFCHASSDAAEPLEPIILAEYANSRAMFVIVDHRGESIGEGWKVWSPGFEQEGERVIPTYKFIEERPSQEILKIHARQLLEDLIEGIEVPESVIEKKQGEGEDYSRLTNQQILQALEETLFGGSR